MSAAVGLRCVCGHAYAQHRDQAWVADGGRCRIYGCECPKFDRAGARPNALPEGKPDRPGSGKHGGIR